MRMQRNKGVFIVVCAVASFVAKSFKFIVLLIVELRFSFHVRKNVGKWHIITMCNAFHMTL